MQTPLSRKEGHRGRVSKPSNVQFHIKLSPYLSSRWQWEKDESRAVSDPAPLGTPLPILPETLHVRYEAKLIHFFTAKWRSLRGLQVGFPQTRAELPLSPGNSFGGKFKWFQVTRSHYLWPRHICHDLVTRSVTKSHYPWPGHTMVRLGSMLGLIIMGMMDMGCISLNLMSQRFRGSWLITFQPFFTCSALFSRFFEEKEGFLLSCKLFCFHFTMSKFYQGILWCLIAFSLVLSTIPYAPPSSKVIEKKRWTLFLTLIILCFYKHRGVVVDTLAMTLSVNRDTMLVLMLWVWHYWLVRWRLRYSSHGSSTWVPIQ